MTMAESASQSPWGRGGGHGAGGWAPRLGFLAAGLCDVSHPLHVGVEETVRTRALSRVSSAGDTGRSFPRAPPDL